MDTRNLNSGKKKTVQKNLSEMSIEALCEYIVELDAEICRVRQVIAKKENAQTKAQSFFKQ